MEVSNTLSQADDGPGDISGVLVPPSEELVNLQGVSNGFDDPQLPWQENDPPPDPFLDDDNLQLASGPSQSTTSGTSTPLPATKRRSRSVLAPESASQKKRKRDKDTTLFVRLHFSVDMTARIMELFLEETRAGNLKDVKSIFMRPALERIRETMKAEFPRHPFDSVKKIEDKLWNEKKRYRALITFLAISGVNFDPVSNVPLAPDNIWESYLAKYPKAGWLRTTPIGDREVYAEVFHRERATGEFTEEPSTCTDFDRDSSIDPDDPDDNSDIEEQELGDVSVVPSPRTPTPASSSDGRRPKRRYALDPGAIAVARGIERLVESNTKVAGANDVSAAIQSFQSSSDSVITTSGKLKVIERLAMPMWAVAWNAMSTEMRSELAKKWASE